MFVVNAAIPLVKFVVHDVTRSHFSLLAWGMVHETMNHLWRDLEAIHRHLNISKHNTNHFVKRQPEQREVDFTLARHTVQGFPRSAQANQNVHKVRTCAETLHVSLK